MALAQPYPTNEPYTRSEPDPAYDPDADFAAMSGQVLHPIGGTIAA